MASVVGYAIDYDHAKAFRLASNSPIRNGAAVDPSKAQQLVDMDGKPTCRKGRRVLAAIKKRKAKK